MLEKRYQVNLLELTVLLQRFTKNKLARPYHQQNVSSDKCQRRFSLVLGLTSSTHRHVVLELFTDPFSLRG